MYSIGQLDHVLKTMTSLFSISRLERKQSLFLKWEKKKYVSVSVAIVRLIYKYKFLGINYLL